MINFWQRLKKPIVGLAPMDGITDEPMRQIQCLVAKPEVVYTEFVSADGLARRPERLLKKLTFQKNERPIIAQLFGVNPTAFTQAALIVKELGFDGLDINMGCPAKTLVSQRGGGALIGQYNLVDKIIQACLTVSLPLSIKTRIALDERSTLDWIAFLCRYPLATLCLHGRSITQLHAGLVNWPMIAKSASLAHQAKILFLGNGGVTTRAEAVEKCCQYDLDGVLIGQAALGNPWLFADRSPGWPEIKKTLLTHAQLAYDFYGPRGFLATRKHFLAYIKCQPRAKVLKSALLTATTPVEIAQLLS